MDVLLINPYDENAVSIKASISKWHSQYLIRWIDGADNKQEKKK